MYKFSALFLLLVLTPIYCNAQETIYTSEDSIKVLNLMNKASKLSPGTDYLLFFGMELIDTPYVGGTLDRNTDEQLTVNLHELDCTTFIETALALSLTLLNNEVTFNNYANNLRFIRYRNGKMEGYASRLHYFSEWIENNEQKGILKDISCQTNSRQLLLKPYYMSAHPDQYKQLKNNYSMQEQIKKYEATLKDKKVCYIPKESLHYPEMMRFIEEGSIIAIVTNIPGLDIIHVGMAVHYKGELHLLHASSEHGRVIIDPKPLYQYLKEKTTMIGIRVVSPFEKLLETN